MYPSPFLVSDCLPAAWSANQTTFEGSGGLQSPDEIHQDTLNCESSCYEVPVAVLQYKISLSSGCKKQIKLCFGAAKDEHRNISQAIRVQFPVQEFFCFFCPLTLALTLTHLLRYYSLRHSNQSINIGLYLFIITKYLFTFIHSFIHSFIHLSPSTLILLIIYIID